jgi:hypothetical protein
MIDQPVTASSLTNQLAQELSIKPEVLRADVTSAVSTFASLGLLEDGAVSRHANAVGRAGPEPPIGSSGVRTATFSVIDQLVAFAVRDREAAEAINWLGAPLVTDASPTTVHAVDSSGASLRLFPTMLNRFATLTDRMVVLHAGAVVAGETVIAIAGAPNAGKSTLVTALVAAGLGYASDEAIGITTGELRVVGYPKRITLELGSWPLFPELAEDAGAAHQAFDPSRVRWIDVRSHWPDALAWQHSRPRPGLVVVPRYEPGAAVRVERLEPVAAFTELLGCAFNLPRVGLDGLETLRDIAEQVPVHRLTHGDARLAAPKVVNLLSGGGGATGHERLRRRPDVLSRRVASGVVLLTNEATDVFEVTGPGADMWELLARAVTFDELVARLAEDYETSPTVVRRDLEPVLTELRRLDAIEVLK